MLLDAIQQSSIATSADVIFVNNIGDPVTIDRKYKEAFGNRLVVQQYGSNIHLYECPTLRIMYEFAQIYPDTKLLYLHTKGISYTGSIYHNETDWITMMLHGLVTHAKECLERLDGSCDTVGLNLVSDPVPQYSGNFWWAKSSYVASLPLHTLTDKMSAEKWLLSNPTVRSLCLWKSGINHFHESYPLEKYKTQMTEAICTGSTLV